MKYSYKSKTRFTKHYFIGSQRVASKIGTGFFNNVYGINGSRVTAGQQDYAARMQQIESQKEEYYRKLGIAPGVPTMKGSYGDPENTGVGYNTVITELGDHSVPEGWVQTPKHNDEQGSNPGAPISWNAPTNPEDATAGYGYIADDTTDVEDIYYFHSDHLGSTSYVTDRKGNITQYDAYLPYGELLVDEHSSSEDMPYKFNGKEMDEETGLYYYGARYMNPMTSLWYGVDPLAEKYVAVGGYVYTIDNPVKLVDLDGKEWTYTIDKNGHITITVSVNFSAGENFSHSQIENYKKAISTEFNKIVSDVSDGNVSGVIDFYEDNKDIVQSLNLSSENGSNIAGNTGCMASNVNVKFGKLKSYSSVAMDVIHEFLHTLRIDHPFERTQAEDTKLISVGPNSFVTTPSTSPDILYNIMNYPMTIINGHTSNAQNTLTQGQLNLMLKEIDLQKQGYGFMPKYNKNLTPLQNEELYKKYYDSYWNGNWPGYPVQSK